MKTAEDYMQEVIEDDEHASAIDAVSLLISDALGIVVFSYNDEVTYQVIEVVLRLAAPNEELLCCDDIAMHVGIDPTHVELIQYLICDKNLAEYGTSPRCCWLTPKGEEMKKMIRELLVAEVVKSD